jgi:hypothetical protein
MTTNAIARRAGNVAVLVVAVLLAACSGIPTGETPANSFCNDISAEVGGCDPNAPAFAGTTCVELATEWGREVDRRLTEIIEGADIVDGEHRSARAHKALVLPTLLVSGRIRELGLTPACDADAFAASAEDSFGVTLREGVGGVLYDGEPQVTYAQWRAEMVKTLDAIEQD